MTAPSLHTNDFDKRDDAPAMSAVSRGMRLVVNYHPTKDDTRRSRTVSGTIRNAGYGKFKDVITFTPSHTDNTWKLEITDNSLSLYYKWGERAGSDWRRLDVVHLDTTAHVEPVRA